LRELDDKNFVLVSNTTNAIIAECAQRQVVHRLGMMYGVMV
jgi:hypothetical protein